ncbi:serine hydrolase [Streptomyces roseochromogenus]|nr:serine hydrolase [Streptomyces roseochromogenus]
MTNSANSRHSAARWTGLAAAGAALVAVCATALPASAATAGPRPSAVGSTLRGPAPVDRQALARLMAPDDVANGTMVRITGPGVHLTETTGRLSRDPAAYFRIGSITKLFTSTVVLQLVGEGRFTMDTPVQEILPGTLPAGWAPITVRRLLSHTSGLGKPCVAPENPGSPTPAAVVAALTDPKCPAPQSPVTVQQYNGLNYFLLGLVVEKTTGHPYAEEVQRRIARPLGLRHTYLPRPGDTSIPAPSLTAPVADDPWAWAEGGMISNAPDLERFLRALLGGRLLAPAQQTELFRMPALSATADVPFSMGGLVRGELDDGTPVWGKTGSKAGGVNGLFGTQDGKRVLVYSYTAVGDDADRQRRRAEDFIEAAF